jgi:hypothetical protein
MSWTLTAQNGQTTAVPIDWAAISSKTERDEGRHRVLGRKNDVFTTGVAHGAELAMSCVVIGEAAWFALTRILDRAETMKLTDPQGADRWVRSVGPFTVSLEPTGDQAVNPVRKISLTFVEQDAPS